MPRTSNVNIASKKKFSAFIVNRYPRYRIGEDYYWSSKQVCEAIGIKTCHLQILLKLGVGRKINQHRQGKTLFPTCELVKLWKGSIVLDTVIPKKLHATHAYAELAPGTQIVDNGESSMWYSIEEELKATEIVERLMRTRMPETTEPTVDPKRHKEQRAYYEEHVRHNLAVTAPALVHDGIRYYNTGQVKSITGLPRHYLDNMSQRGHVVPTKLFQKRWYKPTDIRELVDRSRKHGNTIPVKTKGDKRETLYLATLAR